MINSKQLATQLPRNLSAIGLAILATYIPVSANADSENTDYIEEVVVTATRSERNSKSVPAAVASMSEEKLNKLMMNSISDALQDIPGILTYSKNGLSSSKMIIRGAGLKARYGIREVMVLRDGIPLTEPDSFTRLDTIDGQDIKRLEVTKGPGNLYASGSAGGTIHVITKSVFDLDKGRLKLGLNDDSGRDFHVRMGGDINEDQAMSFTFSHRELNNSWRNRNEQSSNHASIKHGLKFGENNLLETELGFAKVDMELQGSMDETQWEEFKRTGEQTEVESAFKHGGRYSENIFFNTKAEIELDDFLLKPKFYYSQYDHFHPVTGFINDNTDNPPNMIGAEISVEHDHTLAGKEAKAVFGIATRINETKDSKKYTYGDVQTIPSGRIISTLSDNRGELAEISSTKGTLLGIFGSEHFSITDKLSMDISARVDDVNLTIDEDQLIAYNYGTGTYVTGEGVSHYKHEMNLGSFNIGASYALNQKINTFISVAKADQIPADSELNSNPDLKKASNQNFEIGLKGRNERWSFDMSIYEIQGKDEVIQLRQPDGESEYVNAGKTSKQGLELSASYVLSEKLHFGGGISFSNYKYEDFQEEVRVGRDVTNVDRSGNYLPLIPKQQTNLYIDYLLTPSISTQLKLRKSGDYYLDNANTEKWTENELISDLSFRYAYKEHQLDLTVSNLTDERYAIEVSKDTGGDKSYIAGAPRLVLLNYTYNF